MTQIPAPAIEITHFTDPACPFAFSAEPVRRRLQWHYGDALTWRTRMIVLTLEPGEAKKLAQGAPGLQRRYGMPISPAPYARPASSEPACRAIVAARLNSPASEEPLLRRLRVRVMVGGLLDDPQLIAAAALDIGLDPAELKRWCATEAVEEALQADIEATRSPSPSARALDHKLGGPPKRRRYTAPSYEIRRRDRATEIAVPGFNPIEAYEIAIANLAPELHRRPKPDTVEELLTWAHEPLATAEVAALMQLEHAEARAALRVVARPIAAGADFYWTHGSERDATAPRTAGALRTAHRARGEHARLKSEPGRDLTEGSGTSSPIPGIPASGSDTPSLPGSSSVTRLRASRSRGSCKRLSGRHDAGGGCRSSREAATGTP